MGTVLAPDETFVLLHDAQTLSDGSVGMLWSEVPWHSEGIYLNIYQAFYARFKTRTDEKVSVFDDDGMYKTSDLGGADSGFPPPLLRVLGDSIAFFWIDDRACHRGLYKQTCPAKPRHRVYQAAAGLMEAVQSPTPATRSDVPKFDVAADQVRNQLHLTWLDGRLMYRLYSNGKWGDLEKVLALNWKPGRGMYGLRITVDSLGAPVIAMLADDVSTQGDEDVLWVSSRTGKEWRSRKELLPREFALVENSGIRLVASKQTGKLHVLLQPRLRSSGTGLVGTAVRPLLYSELLETGGLRLKMLARDTQAFQIDLAEDGDGRVHAVWVERHGIAYELRHAVVPG